MAAAPLVPTAPAPVLLWSLNLRHSAQHAAMLSTLWIVASGWYAWS
jgi:hypothetical protein